MDSDDFFESLDVFRRGSLDGDVPFPLMRKSNLSTHHLAEI